MAAVGKVHLKVNMSFDNAMLKRATDAYLGRLREAASKLERDINRAVVVGFGEPEGVDASACVDAKA
jgi:predicted RNA-binding protein